MNLIVAIDNKNAIGEKGNLLEHFSCDLKHFKKITTNKIVVMGKNTYYSLPQRPLPNRVNIILSSTMQAEDGCIVCHNMEELSIELDKYNDEDIFVIGGAKIYKELYLYCNKFYVTKILKTYNEADTFFNEIEEITQKSIIQDIETVRERDTILYFITYIVEV